MCSTLREALSNVARHARATRVEVELNVGDDLVLVVRDNGVGIAAGGDGGGGHGLPNMAVRADSLGGRFELAERPRGGTEVRWRVPLDA